MQIHALQIPDALIEWGKKDEVAVRFARPWAHEVEQFANLASERPLKTGETDALLARLEGLVGEAIRAEEYGLLMGFDLLTAEWLDMTFRMRAANGGEVVIGRQREWSYQEIRHLLEEPQSVDFCQEVKALVADAFPQARISAIIDRQKTPDPACAGCGTMDSTVMLTLDSGNDYCAKCWDFLTSPWPKIETKGGKKR
jgi:hypothetical protein